MSFVTSLLARPPSLDDILFVFRTVFTRPGELVGVLKREAARRRAYKRQRDPHGVRGLTSSWEGAQAAGGLRAPQGDGGPLVIEGPVEDVAKAITDLQFASSVVFTRAAKDPAFPALSLEAARLGLAQRSDAPEAAKAARSAFIEKCDLSEGLKSALRELDRQPIDPN
ncbi:MAG: hypothetical protein AAF322_11130 [Pseudomonadota bacterium]